MSTIRRTIAEVLLAWLVAVPVHADEEYGDRRAKPRKSGDLCEVADSNLQRATQAILAQAGKSPTTPIPTVRWDHRQVPKYLDQFERRFTLRPVEKERLFAHGMVSLSRLSFSSYAYALHEIYQSQLPLYVSVDALLHAVYASNDKLIEDLEKQLLLPRLTQTIQRLRSGLPSQQSRYSPEAAQDLDLFLTVAARLLGDSSPALFSQAEAESTRLVAHAKSAKELLQVSLFGRPRMIDFSQYAARGHYTEDPKLSALFQAVMWLSRLELNLVSRSSRSSAPGMAPDPRETPREVTLALALADLAETTGAVADLTAMDRLWTLLAGRREDVSVSDLIALRKQAGITDLRASDLTDKLRGVIGNRFARTVAFHYMPQGSTHLPVIATVLGPRVVPDAQSLRPLVHDATPDRYRISVADLAYGLGHDRALQYLSADLQKFPSLRGQLDQSRNILARAASVTPPTLDLYSAWLQAITGIAATPPGVRPSYMDDPAYADLRINTVAAAFGQLKHNYVLVAGQPYDMGGCEVPDAYVEPAAAVYDSLIEYARRGERVMAELDPSDETAALAYFRRLGRLLKVFRVIVADELAGRPLTVEQKRFLSMVVEMAPGSSGGPPTYTGWYFDLFRHRTTEGLSASQFVADYYTSTNLGEASYVGVSGVRLGVFVVDVGGVPRIVTGPIARAYELHHPFGPQRPRLSDESALDLPESARLDPWAQSYTVAAPADITPLHVTYDPDTSADITVEAEVAIANVTFSLLDHHRQPLASLKRSFPVGKTVFRFPTKSPSGHVLTGAHVGGLSLSHGEFFHSAEVQRHGMGAGVYFGIGKKK